VKGEKIMEIREVYTIDGLCKQFPHLEGIDAAHILHHWLAAHHGGQGSEEYAALCAVGRVFTPGQNEEFDKEQFSEEYAFLCKETSLSCDCAKEGAFAELKEKFDHIDDEVITACLENNHYNVDHASSQLEEYAGTYSSEEEWAREFIEDCYDTRDMGALANYIDYESFARDARLGGDMTFLDLPSGDVACFHN
jgi:hypothetical protein